MISNYRPIMQGKMSLSIVIFLALPFFICSKEIAFFQLEGFTPEQGIVYEIRGFLYKTEKQQYILAAEPNLKSCCVGSASKRNKQILVSGTIDPQLFNSDRPITLKGLLEYDNDREFPWHMTEAKGP